MRAPRRGVIGRAAGAGFALGDQAISSITNFATGVIVGRSCEPEQFGRYVMAFSVMLLLTESLHALVSTPHGIFCPRLRGRRLRRFNGSTLLHCLAMGVACGVGLLAAGGFASVHGGEWREMSPVLLALSVSAWAILARYFGRVFSFNVRRPGAALALDATAMVAQLGGLGLLAATGRLNGWTAVLVVGIANSVAAVAWFAGARRAFEPHPRRAVHELRRTWSLSRWVFFSGILWVVGAQIYPWLIGATLGQDDVGIWGACYGIAAVANPLLMGLQNLIGPAIAHAFPQKSAAEFRRYVFGLSLAFGAALVPFAVLASLFGDGFVRLYGDRYAGHGQIVAVLAVSCVAQAIAFSLSRGLFATGRARQDTLANVLTLAVLAAMGYPLIHGYGVAGAAVCLVVSEAAGAAYRAVAFSLVPVAAAEVAS